MVVFCWIWVGCSVVMTLLICARFAHYRERIANLETVTLDLGKQAAIEKDSFRAMMMLERIAVRSLQTKLDELRASLQKQIDELERRGNSDRESSLQWRSFMTTSSDELRAGIADVKVSVSKLSSMLSSAEECSQ